MTSFDELQSKFQLTKEMCDSLYHIISTGEGKPLERNEDLSILRQRAYITSDDGDTEVLYAAVGGQCIVVETVVLSNRRNGTFTRFMSRMQELARGTSIEYIDISSVLTSEMLNWCMSHGYRRVLGHTYDEHGLGGSYRFTLK